MSIELITAFQREQMLDRERLVVKNLNAKLGKVEAPSNPYLETPTDYIDPECEPQQTRITEVSVFMAGRAFNELCLMFDGRNPGCQLQEKAPEAYAFFMKLLDA